MTLYAINLVSLPGYLFIQAKEELTQMGAKLDEWHIGYADLSDQQVADLREQYAIDGYPSIIGRQLDAVPETNTIKVDGIKKEYYMVS